MKSSTVHFFGNILKSVLPEEAVTRLRDDKFRKLTAESFISHESPAKRFFRRTFTNKKPPIFHFEMHLVDHCNLNCKGCEPYSSITKEPWFADMDEFTKDLQRVSELFSEIEQIFLLGGEPLLHPKLNDFLVAARKILPNTRIYLFTNGILLPRMDETFWKTMNEQNIIIFCDDYPINIDRDKIDALCAEHKVAIRWVPKVTEFFRVPIDATASQDPKASFRRCRGVSNCATLRAGKVYPCGRAAYSDNLVKAFPEKGLEAILPGEHDSISIHAEVDGDTIIDMLMNPVPWCAHCAYDNFSTFRWDRTEQNPDEWLLTDKERKLSSCK